MMSGRIIETLKEFSVRARCQDCKNVQQIPVRWIRLADRTVMCEVFGKACAYCHRYPGRFTIDVAEAMGEYNQNWGPLAPEIQKRVGKGFAS